MRKAGFVRYRQTKYRMNYENEGNDEYPNWAWAWLGLLFLSPFLAAMILNPFMWLMVFLIWLAWKLVHGFKKGE